MAEEFTIVDVAKAAGVSVSTVSRILNGKQDVAPATRERVQRVIEELGYSPHAQAQRLRAGKTRNIALLFPFKYPGDVPFNPLDMDFIVGAAAAAGEREFFFNLMTNAVTKRSLLNLYRSAQVDGTVLMQVHTHDWRVELLRQRGYPFVMIGHCEDNEGLSFIDLDFEAAVVVAFDHLVELGHRRIGFLAQSHELRESGYGPAARSWSGYQQALQTHPIETAFREVGFAGKDAFAATLELLDQLPGLSAIVTTHALPGAEHRSGAECARAARAGRLLGDRRDREPHCQFGTPPLTTIDFPSYDMGYRAVEMLTRNLSGTLSEPEQILIPPQLIVRQSTSRAP